jgi:Gpi18-like mannosyltransferase
MKRSAALTLAHMHKKYNAKWAFDKYGHELRVFSKTGKAVSLLIPTVGKHTFKDGDLQYALAIPSGVPIPTNLTVICTAKELNCVIPNCTLKASQ